MITLSQTIVVYLHYKQLKVMKQKEKKMYSEEEVKNMLVDVSNFINTKELKDISDVDFNKWIYKRDWFINFLFDFDKEYDEEVHD